MSLPVQATSSCKRWPWLVIVFWVGLALWGPPPAGAYTVQQILQPYYDDIQLCIDAMNAYNLAAMRRRGELNQQLSQAVTDLRNGLGANLMRYKEELARRNAVDKAMREGFGRLIIDPFARGDKRSAHVPHFGWLNPKTLQQRHRQHLEQMRRDQAALNSGDTTLWVITVGHTNRKALQARVAAKQKAKSDFRVAVRRGDFKIYFPGLGWVNHVQLRQRAAQDQKKIDEIRDQIRRGVYRVHIPHLGWVTRNDVLARIKKVDDAIAATNRQFRLGRAKVFRHYLGWTDLKTLQATIKKQMQRKSDLLDSLAKGTFKANLAGVGWTSRNDLDARIRKTLKEMDQVKTLLRTGHYRVPVNGFGWMDRKQIEQQLRRKGLTKQQKANLVRGLNHIGAASGIDLRIRGIELNRLRTCRNAIGQHAFPLKVSLHANIQRLRQYQQEAFSNERNSILGRLQRQRAFLQQCLNLIPSKLPPLPPKKPLKLQFSM